MATNKEQLQLIVEAQGIAKTKAQLKAMEKQTGTATSGFVAMGVAVAGATTAMLALGKAVAVGMEFEQAMAKVGAISRATSKEFEMLEKNARSLGGSTSFTASEVAGLQTEFAKLGFTATEINKVTKGTLALAGATGSDLADAAGIAGTTLRGFGLDVEETNRVTNLMAASFSQSALDMQKFSDSMTYVAPVAKMAGFEVEGTTAMLGQLANAGISGSMAGTALRRIFLELSNESSKLSNRLGGSVSSVDELVPALIKLKEEGISTAEMKDLVGQRAVSAFSILLDGASDVDTLTESITDTNEANRQYDLMMDTIQGKTDEMNSAFANLGITVFGIVDGPLESMIESITELVANMDEKDVISFAVALGTASTAMIGFSGSMTMASIAAKALRVALMSTGIGAIAVVAGLATNAILEMTGAFDSLDETQDTLDDIGESVEKVGDLIGESFELDIGETLAPIQDQLEETFGEGTKIDQDKLNEDLAKQYNDALDILVAYGVAKRNEEKDSRLIALDEEQAQMEQAMEVLKLSKEREEEILKDFAKKRKKINDDILKDDKAKDKAKLMSSLDTTGKLMGAMSQLNSASKGSALVTARLQQGAIIANTASAAMAAISPPTGAPTPLGFMNMAAVIAAGLAQGIQIEQGLSDIKKVEQAQYGMDEVVSQPTMILAGEGGMAEKVEITPLEGPNIDGPQGGGGITLNISGNVMSQDFVEGQLADSIRDAVRRGTDFGIN